MQIRNQKSSNTFELDYSGTQAQNLKNKHETSTRNQLGLNNNSRLYARVKFYRYEQASKACEPLVNPKKSHQFA